MSVEELIVAPAQKAAPRKSAWRKLLKDPQAVVTASLLLVIALLGILTPLLTQLGPNEVSLDAINAPAGTAGYPLGGDQNGQDIFTRLLHSINTSMVSGLIGTSVALVIGVPFGLIGGYCGRKVQGVTEWLFSLIMTFPGILMLILLMPVTKGDYRFTMLIFGVMLSPQIYRIVRNQVLGVKNELFVDAAKVSGLPDLRILARHVLFVVRGPIIIAAAFLFGSAIGIQSGLAFLGVGSNTIPSFGSMIGDGFLNLYTAPGQFLWPSMLLGLITASLVLFGNALRDAFEGVRPKPVKRSIVQKQAAQAGARKSAGPDSLLRIENLAIAYRTPSGELKEVVSGVNLSLGGGQTLGLVGESGSGKTQTAFAILGVLPPEAVITRGSITLDGKELLGLSERELRAIRGRSIAYIPQEPMSNLDPSFSVGDQLVEGIRASANMTAKEAKERVLALLKRVGIQDPQRTYNSYPHQISGGMAQRVLIAGAVASRPKLLIADEPTTALDVTVQAEILDLLRDLQAELNMAVLLVTHNFGVVADICDRIAVMQNGKIVETGQTLDIFRNPQHPYTAMLLNSILDETTVRTDAPMAARDTVRK
ncbi:dipeptide/oligopeptide/nickel ABC transporter permease/ATP-binding protein (plasmid) [Arthrobacter sp. G.S.26]|uniref:dipeptide/oligopeptide/nickel ABC transporter permease/ATP-binding protein n=1 Tax=Arthrobacter sp. G.S.26 TaxID=3433706 RepID=UPI003D76B762